MRLVCISDTHLSHPGTSLTRGTFPDMPPGDVLIHAGDALNRGGREELIEFAPWLESLPYKHKIYVPGNHDCCFETKRAQAERIMARLAPSVTLLLDSGTVIEGLFFWGSPWQPFFYDWAFQLPRDSDAIDAKWQQIPNTTDVLITHGPPFGILDKVSKGYREDRPGCERLRRHVLDRVRPKLHVFGHIHASHGTEQWAENQPLFVNAAICDEAYNPTNKPIEVEL